MIGKLLCGVTRLVGLLALGAIIAGVSLAPKLATAQPAGDPPPNPEEILRSFVVRATATRSLPKIAVQPSLASNIEDVTIRTVVRRDLDLCGEFEVIPDSAAPDGLYLSDTPVDVKAWAAKGANAVVKVSGKELDTGRVQLRGLAYFADTGDQPVFDKTFVVNANRVRVESHRVADALIGALTGTNGGFASQMTFVYGTGKTRRVYVMDADGHDPKPMSPDHHLVLAPTFGPDHQLYYAASINYAPYQIFSPDDYDPATVKPDGSVYGIAFSPKRDQVAVSIAVGADIHMFAGPSFSQLQQVSPVGMALRPAYTPSGKLAFSGAGKWGQRIYVDGKAISPAGLNASAPSFCRHPEGVRAVYAVGLGKNTDLVASSERGGSPVRLTQNRGRNNYPACSPDGRLVAFFSTRTSGEGPGLYIMRVDGLRPKRVSTLVGDSLRWARLPAATE
jgi:TolB protein